MRTRGIKAPRHQGIEASRYKLQHGRSHRNRSPASPSLVIAHAARRSHPGQGRDCFVAPVLAIQGDDSESIHLTRSLGAFMAPVHGHLSLLISPTNWNLLSFTMKPPMSVRFVSPLSSKLNGPVIPSKFFVWRSASRILARSLPPVRLTASSVTMVA